MVMVASGPLENLKRYRLVLASGSPRRRELLGMLGVKFDIAPSIDVDESYPKSIDSLEVAQYVAMKKAEAYKPFMSNDDLYVTADTVVVNRGCVMGKPHDADDARRMLRSLSGHAHTVVTGVAVFDKVRTESFSAMTKVEFADLTDAEIDSYVAKCHPFDKAGAYGIQEWIGCIGVSRIDGSFYNVMGLPLHRLYNVLKSF